MEKNSDPARAMVTRVSPAMASTWATASRENGDCDCATSAGRAGLCSGSQPLPESFPSELPATAAIVGAGGPVS